MCKFEFKLLFFLSKYNGEEFLTFYINKILTLNLNYYYYRFNQFLNELLLFLACFLFSKLSFKN